MRSAVAILALFFCLHFVLLIIFSLPRNTVHPVLESYSFQYTQPMFYQGWKLFAPDVITTESEAEYRYWNSESGWSEWCDPEILNGRKSDVLRYIPRKSITHITKDFSTKLYYNEGGQPQFDAVMNSSRLHHFWRFIYKHHKLNNEVPADSLQLKFHFQKVPDPGIERTEKRTFVLPAIPTGE